MLNFATALATITVATTAISSLPSISAFSTSETTARFHRTMKKKSTSYLEYSEYQPGGIGGIGGGGGSYDNMMNIGGAPGVGAGMMGAPGSGAPVPPGGPPPDMAFDRAVDCANNFGMCDIDELLDLSEELDEFLECYVEDGPEACEREIDDRQDLSEALLVQGEMREHQRYIEEGNIFAYEDNGLVNGIDTAGNNVGGVIGGGGDSSSMNTPPPRASVWREDDEPDFLWGNDRVGM